MNASASSIVLDRSQPAARTLCRHCADPCDDRTAIVSQHGMFCCAGCEAVFSLISAHGLAAFYSCDVTPGVSQRAAARDPGRFAALDEPASVARFVETVDCDTAAVTFQVPALHCASCLWLIEQLWRFDPGIARSEADLMRRTVRVEFRPDQTTLRTVAERLASLGYEPVVDAEGAAARTPSIRRDLYLRIGVAGFAFGNVMLFSIPRYVNGAPLEGGFQHLFDVLNILLAIPVLVFSASPYFRAAWAALRVGAITLEVPVALGLIVLFGRSVADIAMGWGEGFLDSFSGLVFFLLIGRLFQQKAFDGIAFDRTARSFFPLSIRVERKGELRMTPLEQIRVGDLMVVRPQEVVPADSVLLDQTGAIDYAFVSGEAAPAMVSHGEAVHAGGRVVGHTLRLAATKEVSHSRLAQLWDHPVFAKPKQDWLTRITAAFGFWFVVFAVGLAVLGALLWWPDARRSAEVATAVLIIACPCALTLAAPITLGTAMGLLGRVGIYLKRAAVALDLSRVDTIVFDKTGTLTSGTADAAVASYGLTAEQWLLARRLAAESVHPISRALAGRDALPGEVADLDESPGRGLSGLVNGHRVVIGAPGYIQEKIGRSLDSVVDRTWICVDDAIGWIKLSTPDRPGVRGVVHALSSRFDVWLLSGDHDGEAPRFEPIFGERMRFRQSPEEKLAFVRELQAAGHRVAMVGDGLNDAGALAAADVGIAVCDDTACLVPACDVVVRGDRLAYLSTLLRYTKLGRRVVVLCFAVSVFYNIIGLWLALAGRLTPLATAILMPVSSLTIVGLSVGLMRRAGNQMLPLRAEGAVAKTEGASE